MSYEIGQLPVTVTKRRHEIAGQMTTLPRVELRRPTGPPLLQPVGAMRIEAAHPMAKSRESDTAHAGCRDAAAPTRDEQDRAQAASVGLV